MSEEQDNAGTTTRRAGRPGRTGRMLICAGGLAAAGLIFGFLVFSAHGTEEPDTSSLKADGIVALTGGAQRLRVAGDLLRQQRARHLLISGVNRVVTPRDLRRLVGVDPDLFACCVSIDYRAQNTRGNANETLAWVRKHNFKRLIVVTSSYHMPRSLVELGRVMPDVDLLAVPVLPARFRDRPWWLDAGDARLLAAEYLKFLPAALHYGIERVTQTPGGRAAPTDQKAVAVQ